MSREDRSGADQVDAEHQATDLAVGVVGGAVALLVAALEAGRAWMPRRAAPRGAAGTARAGDVGAARACAGQEADHARRGLGERRDATVPLGWRYCLRSGCCGGAGARRRWRQPLRRKTDSRPVAVTGCGLWGTSFEPGGGDRGGIRGGGLPSPSWRPPHARDADAVGPDGEPSPRAPGARRPAEQADSQGSCTTLRRIGSWPHLGSCVRVEARRRRLWTCLPSFGLNLDLSTAVERSRWSWRLRLREVGHSHGHATCRNGPGQKRTRQTEPPT